MSLGSDTQLTALPARATARWCVDAPGDDRARAGRADHRPVRQPGPADLVPADAGAHGGTARRDRLLAARRPRPATRSPRSSARASRPPTSSTRWTSRWAPCGSRTRTTRPSPAVRLAGFAALRRLAGVPAGLLRLRHEESGLADLRPGPRPNDANAARGAGKLAGTDGYYWEMGVTVQATSFGNGAPAAGATTFTIRLLQEPDPE